MKAKFYHLWAYWIFYKLWTPLIIQEPKLIDAITDDMKNWIKLHKPIDT